MTQLTRPNMSDLVSQSTVQLIVTINSNEFFNLRKINYFVFIIFNFLKKTILF